MAKLTRTNSQDYFSVGLNKRTRYQLVAAGGIDDLPEPIQNPTEHSDYLAGLATAEDFINGKS